MNDLFYWVALHLVPGVGAVTFRQLVKHFGTPKEVFEADTKDLTEVRGLKPASIEEIRKFSTGKRAEYSCRLMQKLCVEVITFEHPAYPPNLASLYDAPALLYVKGRLTEADNYSVAVVGSRHATFYGQQTTENLCRCLANYQVTIVSGMARGIDTAAHKGALSGKGRTIAVMGSGIDVIYPEENARLYGSISENGAVISEYPFGAPPEPKNFPIRNRIISGLALGIVVVEATQKSGSLITANFALEQGREVFAVPGSINSLRSSGTHKLIKQGAKLVERAEDVLEELEVYRKRDTAAPLQAPEICSPPVRDVQLSDDEKALLYGLDAYPQHIDDIVRQGGLAVQKISSMLLGLELKGLVEQLPGKFFIRK